MWHTILISAHAVTATAALTAGVIAIPRARMFGVYLGSLVAMEVFMVLAIAVEWQVIDAPTRFVFAALAGLGAVVVWCGLRAGRVRPRDGAGPTARYVENVGFTLVALVDAFLVIAVLNAGAPGWAVAATGILVAAVGHVVLRTQRRRLVPKGPPDPHKRAHRQDDVRWPGLSDAPTKPSRSAGSGYTLTEEVDVEASEELAFRRRPVPPCGP